HRLGKLAEVVHVFLQVLGDKAEIQVAQIVVYGPAPGQAPHYVDAFGIHVLPVDLLHGVLVAPDDDRGLVDVEEENVFAGGDIAQQVFLQGQVDGRIGYVFVIDKDHGG